MVDTLLSLREEIGDQPLCLALGMDAFAGLESWHRWSEISALCHLVVMQRPGNRWPAQAALRRLVSTSRVDEIDILYTRPAGCVYAVPVTQLSISSTQIRELLAAGRSPRYLLPDTVIERIMQENWYAN
jgi:nicotinate-nucleotide adenylyltransferase